LTEPLQEIFSRQDAKSAKKKYFPVSELGDLCAFAGVIGFSVSQYSTENVKYVWLVFVRRTWRLDS
jgi:hypothetical protein